MSDAREDGAQAPDQRRPDPAASMSLLTELLEHPLDPAYQWESDRRVAAGKPPADSMRSPWIFVLAVAVGLALAISAASLRVPVGQAQKQRNQLISRIDSAQVSISRNTNTIDGLNREIRGLQTSALRKDNKSSVADSLVRLSAQTGDSAVTGPGMVLSIDNPVNNDTNGTDPRNTNAAAAGATISSSDLQTITNSLWQAGAEAISINGQRLTSLTAIRFAGQAVLVNFRPLQPPYVISSVGPPSMPGAFDHTVGGTFLKGLVDQFGVQLHRDVKSKVNVPALAVPTLKYAHPLKENP